MTLKKVFRDKREINCHYYSHHNSPITLIFVHGMGGRQTQWRHQAIFFKHFFNVITLDLPGHGQSPIIKNHTENPYMLDEYVKDIAYVISKLGSKENIIIGHSRGGAYAYATAKKHSLILNITQLILVSPSPCTKLDAESFSFWSQSLSTLENIRDNMNQFFASSGFHPDTQQTLIDEQVNAGKTNNLEVIKKLNLGMQDLENTDNFNIPTLLITSPEDKIVSAESSISFYQNINNITYASMNKSGHFAPLEEPERMNKIILTWILELSPV
ncbi:alpha/beta fold hydrolase [Cysteiniphilum halobium]|uniref:alpha/beta fold hydrolase n=1 Tax=Cysteiniphilum halobium TaxID=2219059 RepID=UPI000E65928A|nr:alpha/beta hydrolase [Cysteiniphilum halobium]